MAIPNMFAGRGKKTSIDPAVENLPDIVAYTQTTKYGYSKLPAPEDLFQLASNAIKARVVQHENNDVSLPFFNDLTQAICNGSFNADQANELLKQVEAAKLEVARIKSKVTFTKVIVGVDGIPNIPDPTEAQAKVEVQMRNIWDAHAAGAPSFWK